jgi:DNA-binding beta-propeller fold protein YncE
MIYVTRGENVYTTNMGSGTVSILTDSVMQPGPRHLWREGTACLATNPDSGVERLTEGFDVTPDGQQLWTAASEDGVISIIDLPTKKIG